MSTCKQCGTNIKERNRSYCSNKCQSDHNYAIYISKWQKGLVSGGRGIKAKNLSGHIIRYITEKYDKKCACCGWCEVNSATGTSPLEIDHIDGCSENNLENNLILLCPNCHSLTNNYKNLNIGHGRLWRREKYVKID